MRSLTPFRAVLLAALTLGAARIPPVAAQSPDEDFAAAFERLRRGPTYRADVPKGRIELTRANADGLVHRYVLIVPDDYDAARRYPVAFYLHGGVTRPDPGPGGGWWRNYDVVEGHDRIAVVPLSWNESYWWQGSQVENLRGILSDVKGQYNVDENRVYAFGSSDGLFNLGGALSVVQVLPPGVYIAMNGHVFDWDKVRKNRDTGVFEVLPGPT